MAQDQATADSAGRGVRGCTGLCRGRDGGAARRTRRNARTASCAPSPMPRTRASAANGTGARPSSMAARAWPATCCRSMTTSAARSMRRPTNSARSPAALIEGVELTLRELTNVLTKHGVTTDQPRHRRYLRSATASGDVRGAASWHQGRPDHPGDDRRLPAARPAAAPGAGRRFIQHPGLIRTGSGPAFDSAGPIPLRPVPARRCRRSG